VVVVQSFAATEVDITAHFGGGRHWSEAWCECSPWFSTSYPNKATVVVRWCPFSGSRSIIYNNGGGSVTTVVVQ